MDQTFYLKRVWFELHVFEVRELWIYAEKSNLHEMSSAIIYMGGDMSIERSYLTNQLKTSKLTNQITHLSIKCSKIH